MTTLAPTRPGPRLLLVAAAATLVAMVSGCGSGDDATIVEPGAGASSAPSTSASRATDLTVTMDDGNGKTTTWTVTCPEQGAPGGTHPNPAKACAVLAENGAKALPAVSPDLMCSQIYGGPQTAKITGTYLGAAVSSSLSRTNGCEISRWDELAGLIPAVGASKGAAAPQ